MIPVLPGPGRRSRELYLCLRRLIETGRVTPGTKLPTTRDLSQRLMLSRSAAVEAYELLAAEGFAEARVGAGTFVAEAVPRVAAEKPARKAGDGDADEIFEAAPMLCTLGVATADPRTETVFRKALVRRLERPGPGHYAYGDPRGSTDLRRAIAAYLKIARGVRCHSGQVVITTGTRQGFELGLRAAVRPGQAVWIEDPCYRASLETLIASAPGPCRWPWTGRAWTLRLARRRTRRRRRSTARRRTSFRSG
ncbi:aminotransferase class I/II-fold pyridoxal phosphate-dependent enzyme [Methylobrevis pamukkalensis]|uniref:aminotransferase class I/II-fold pyridoxal phosphate-dependent enzyme n=1 Tax=Methylobrevis pamukkalensis TaxID=1439726 RepID=UPI002478026B|nr:aminotransferase class I/II-fold pyridoxal phosphate-dependent enzyme [Methylobrevis pamukkalensis]